MKSEVSKWRWPSARDVHFDIDTRLDRFVPPNPIRRFPKPVARFLGHRDVPAPEIGNILVGLWAMLGAFLGLLVVGATFRFAHGLQKHYPPVLFASLGATAVLDYLTITSPLAQPRAALLGHAFSAIIGVAIAKLFMLSPDFLEIRWVAAPVACACASFIMGMTNTIHPPGGATAVLAVVDPTVAAMGWMFVPFILLGSLLMFGIAILVNNVQRQFPVFWWTRETVGGFWRKEKRPLDVENLATVETKARIPEGAGAVGYEQTITLSAESVTVPEGFELDDHEARALQLLRERLDVWLSGGYEKSVQFGDRSISTSGSEKTCGSGKTV